MGALRTMHSSKRNEGVKKMIVKLKCVDNVDYLGLVSTYLTNGKVYDAIISESGEVALICDEGELINDNLSDSIYAKWGVVSE